jgi:hypothetical protein
MMATLRPRFCLIFLAVLVLVFNAFSHNYKNLGGYYDTKDTAQQPIASHGALQNDTQPVSAAVPSKGIAEVQNSPRPRTPAPAPGRTARAGRTTEDALFDNNAENIIVSRKEDDSLHATPTSQPTSPPTSQPTSQPEKTLQPTTVPHSKNTVALAIDESTERVDPATRAALKLNLTEIILLQGEKKVQSVAGQSFKGGPFCRMVEAKIFARSGNTTDDSKTRERLLPQQPTTPILLNATFECRKLFSGTSVGTGNYLILFYGIRLAARTIGNIHVLFTCADAEDHKSDLIIPWVMGWFPASSSSSVLDDISIEEACGSFHTVPVHYMLDEMKYEMRRLAVALVGVPDPSHPSAAFAIEEKNETRSGSGKNILQVTMPGEPLFPNVELDDAVMHIRCGE